MRTLITALLFDDELPVKNKPLVVDDEPPALVDEPPVEDEKPLSGLEVRFYLPFLWLVAERGFTLAIHSLLVIAHLVFYVVLPAALVVSIVVHIFVLLAQFTKPMERLDAHDDGKPLPVAPKPGGWWRALLDADWPPSG